MITIYLILQAVSFAIVIAAFLSVEKFLKRHNSITRPHELDSFKRMARFNMYAALVYIVLTIPLVLMSLALTFWYGLMGLAIVLAISVPQTLFSFHMKKREEKTRLMQCSSDLAAEHQQVAHSWLKKAVPDF